MVRRVTPAQYNQMVRRHNAEVDRINRANRAAANREIDRINRHNKKVVDDHNRAIRQNNQNARVAVSKYNQAVRAHNAAVRQDHQRRQNQLAQLRRQASTQYVEVQTSTFDLSGRFERVEHEARSSAAISELLALSEREASNSADVAQALVADSPATPEIAEDTGILEYLSGFSQDLCDRWKGALYALNPVNTDAARHFCTSVREIFTEILEKWADNEDVLADDPACDLTPNGTPSRRAKIRYLLRKKGADSPEMLGFVEKDIEDILQLFRVFNEATHGAAGKHGYAKLQSIRHRVEGGIMFLAAVAL